MTGFQLRALRVTGKEKTTAELSFGPGCNVISGASNTGKSYVLQCIDFAFGAGTKPKTIDESLGYDRVELEFEDRSGVRHRLERSLKGGAALHSILKGESWTEADPPTLSGKHSPDNPDTVSGLLLQLSELWDKKVRTNQSGHTDSLSFRDIAHLTFINEKRIIEDASPIFTGKYNTETKEASVFNLLLTGVDDSSVIAHETQKQNQARRKAQLELLDRMIGRTEEQISKADREPASAGDRKRRVDEAIAQRTEVVTTNQNEIAAQEHRRQQAWSLFQEVSAKRNTTEHLRSRFKLLEEHYRSDLARLRAIIEADHYFSQLQEVCCPLCGGAIVDNEAHVHRSEGSTELVNLRTACHEEVRKIQSLLKELLGTTLQLDAELSDLVQREQQQAELYQDVTERIERELAPRAKQLQGELSELMENRDNLAYVEMLRERLAGLQQERETVAEEVWKKQPIEDDGQQEILVPQAIEKFSLIVESILKEWQYPDLTRVTFNNERYDLILSGKDRASEGKGFRAIAYSAFIIGLLRYCAEHGLAHSGVVALDSPLVTYRRKDTQPGEAIPEDVSRAFYEALALTPADRQIIILENEDPPESVHSKLHYTHFSRSYEVGRYGFFPAKKKPAI